MNHRALKKLNSYVIWIDDYGSVCVNQWLELYSGRIIFCWGELINYAEITKKSEETPFVNREKTIEEVIEECVRYGIFTVPHIIHGLLNMRM